MVFRALAEIGRGETSLAEVQGTPHGLRSAACNRVPVGGDRDPLTNVAADLGRAWLSERNLLAVPGGRPCSTVGDSNGPLPAVSPIAGFLLIYFDFSVLLNAGG